MEYLKIACGIIAWVALCFGGCAAMVGVIALCGKEDNGDYVEPNEGK
jgi:chromate transport protein ChrA